MKRSKVFEELNNKYCGRPITPTSIIEIVLEAMEMFRKLEREEIEQNKQIERKKDGKQTNYI